MVNLTKGRRQRACIGVWTDTGAFFLFFFYFKGILVLLMPTVTVASNLIFPPPKSVGSLGVCFFSFFLASL